MSTPVDAHIVRLEPLTGATFAPFGQVIEIPADGGYDINGGTSRRWDNVATLDLNRDGGAPLLSLFRASPCSLPLTIAMLERHVLSSQAFLPLSRRCFLVVVAPPSDTIDASRIRAFRTSPGQGVNYAPGIWHHPLLALDNASDFAVIGRGAADTDCDIIRFDNIIVVTD